MDESKASGRGRKFVHVWDVFPNGEKKADKTEKSIPVLNKTNKNQAGKNTNIFYADGTQSSVTGNKMLPSRKMNGHKGPAPPPPAKDPVIYEEIPGSDVTSDDYDPVTGISFKKSQPAAQFAKAPGRAETSSESDELDDIFPMNNKITTQHIFGTSGKESVMSTRASSGYYSDADVKPEVTTKHAQDTHQTEPKSSAMTARPESPEFDEEELTLVFEEEEEEEDEVTKNTKLYQEYEGEDFATYMDDEQEKKPKRGKGISRKTKKKKQLKTKDNEKKILTDTCKDSILTSFSGTLLSFTGAGLKKKRTTSSGKLSNFSYSDSKIGSTRPAAPRSFSTPDYSDNSRPEIKKEIRSNSNSNIILKSGSKTSKDQNVDDVFLADTENNFSVFNIDQREGTDINDFESDRKIRIFGGFHTGLTLSRQFDACYAQKRGAKQANFVGNRVQNPLLANAGR